MTRTVYRICPLCEATCNLEITLDGRDVKLVRGDRADVYSKGFICPKGSAIGHLESDPDRVRRPRIRDRATDTWRETDWDDAFAYIAARLEPLLDEHGRDALAVYLGNPCAHNLAPLLYGRVLLQSSRTKNVFSASTVDQMPKQVSAGYMFGTALSIPVADVDHTDYLLILGANPFASNGSLMTAPDLPGRLRALRARGGKLVVVDPRRSKTAEEADEWLAIRPGADAAFLLSLAHVLVAEGLADPGAHVAPHLAGLDVVHDLVAPFAPEAVARACGIAADDIRRIARELAAAPTAAVYGRIGTTTTEFGTVASWAVDVVNVLTGNLDRRGGAMFNLPATGGANTGGEGGKGRGITVGRRRSRVKDMPEVFGELPAATLPDEIETPGEGQVRALVTIAGNPVLSNPDSSRLDAALASLEFMVSVDIYCNETTRHADVILPGESMLARGHYDLALRSLAVRNVAHYSPPALPLDAGEYPEWRTLLRLAAILQGLGHGDDAVDVVDDFVLRGLVERAVTRPGPLEGQDADTVVDELSKHGRRGCERVVDLMLRSGPYADRLTLDVLIDHPHGIDLGPLEPRLPEVLRTPSGKIELAPEPIVADVRERLVPALEAWGSANGDSLLLVGRRDLRSNNSWMHNLRVLVKGKPRCTLHVHPDDAARIGLDDGVIAHVASEAGSVEIPVEVTDAIRAGVVSIPHGWGHGGDGVQLSIAREHAGVNTNVLTRPDLLDPLSGTSALNAIPVEVRPATARVRV
jgi:anaerobic selenocysteine-containing dehydrogenase